MKLFQKITFALLLCENFAACEAKRPHSFLIPNTVTVDQSPITSENLHGKSQNSVGNEVQTVSSSIIHGVEVVEKAFVDAIRDEVEVFFHDTHLDHAKLQENVKVKSPKVHHTKIVHVEHEKAGEMSDLEYFTLNHF
eukprot:CAMPEP_0176497516 /NCGR_PEP_ID=MMETSP0200_2-20121128/11763_1 /TAXON_ID=947934 /ORGANISM="Chaetoceros sp., Strain GSL56" /LENGTH=136 /DNA_ID=CAMNT_0017895529 /DNA_START=172 /DNA_END=579 /DNA_ORIENTATION=-